MSDQNYSKRNPVAIGGIGGSGTRLIAEIVRKTGFYMGSSLNLNCDNLWFTLLLKRSSWYSRFPPDSEIFPAIALFQKSMTAGLSGNISLHETDYISNISRQPDPLAPRAAALPLIAEQLINSEPPNYASYIGWGWKEPNTYIFLPQIAAVIDGLKYIHVIRNGLDMAFSANQQQIRNWGAFMGMEQAGDETSIPARSLDYWIAANRRVLKIGTGQLQNRFLLVNYDQFCTHPETEIRRLFAFLGVTLPTNEVAAWTRMVTPRSIGRHKKFASELFSPSQLAAVRELGFEV